MVKNIPVKANDAIVIIKQGKRLRMIVESVGANNELVARDDFDESYTVKFSQIKTLVTASGGVYNY